MPSSPPESLSVSPNRPAAQPDPADPHAALCRAVRRGDRGAFEKLVDLTRPRLLRMALAFGASPEDAPDLVQEVLIGAWRHASELDPEKGTFLAWVARGLHGRVANLRRGEGRRDRFLDRWRDETGHPEEQAHRPQGAVEARITLAKLLVCLSPRQREVVALYELGGLSGRETAGLLGIGEAAVRSIARDARRQLKMLAREEGVGRVAS